MDLLLDTHVFLWWDAGGASLNAQARSAIADPANRVFVSAASVWEIGIKRRTGKLAYSGSIVGGVEKNGFIELSILSSDAEAAAALEWSHNDPCDRLLVAQAQGRGMTFVSADTAVRAFDGVAFFNAQ